MALYVTTMVDGLRRSKTLHVDNMKRYSDESLCKTPVVSIQADGDELEYIRNKFSNLKMSNGRVVSWFGDDAKFIVGNW